MSDTRKTQELFEAIQHGNTAMVREMIQIEPSLAVATIPTGHGVLHAAALYDRPEMVPILLGFGAQLDLADPVGNVTPLQMAVMQNHEAVVAALLSAGADTNTRNSIGWTPLHDAAYGGSVVLIDALLSHNSHINAQDDAGNTPAAVASLNGEAAAARHLQDRGGH